MGLITDTDTYLNDGYALMQLDNLGVSGHGKDNEAIDIYTPSSPLHDRIRTGLADIMMDYPRMRDLFMEVWRGRTLTKSKFTDRMVRFDNRSRNKDISVSEINKDMTDICFSPTLEAWARCMDSTTPYQPSSIRTSSFRVRLNKANDMFDMTHRIYDFLVECDIIKDDIGYGPRNSINFTMLIHHYFCLRHHERNSCGMHFAIELIEKNYVGQTYWKYWGPAGEVTWSVKYPGE